MERPERQARIANRDATIAQLEAKLAAAHKNSARCFTAPSSDSANPLPKPQKGGRRKRGKIGGQPVHPRYLRTLVSPDLLDDQRVWRDDQWLGCGGGAWSMPRTPRRARQLVQKGDGRNSVRHQIC